MWLTPLARVSRSADLPSADNTVAIRGFDSPDTRPPARPQLGRSPNLAKPCQNPANQASSDTSSNRLDVSKEKRAKLDKSGHLWAFRPRPPGFACHRPAVGEQELPALAVRHIVNGGADQGFTDSARSNVRWDWS